MAIRKGVGPGVLCVPNSKVVRILSLPCSGNYTSLGWPFEFNGVPAKVKADFEQDGPFIGSSYAWHIYLAGTQLV
jgi:hypothetical protein